ncbi:uncharacterized protein [Cardiocondyla obscurior]|uniref:uncharacterized protein n=1 Tax=Cardiocondyla obscurior TaxID=286306 RepID=UPI0039656DA2
MAELDKVHDTHNNLLFATDVDEDAMDKEMEEDDWYKTHFLAAKLQMAGILANAEEVARPAPVVSAKTTAKLPRLELPKFGGMVKDWLPFWSQFKKIHEDTTITREDKFQYLRQAMVAGSRADEVVRSFPSTGENYEKTMTCLKNRFGRDDLVVEYYVRQLLSLVLQNALKGGKRLALNSLYDKLECYIRALETFGVMTHKYAAMLYPLVESSLPEETLRAWQRSGQRAEEQPETSDRLSNLLGFLQREVENEKRTDMTLTGFALLSEPNKIKKAKSKPEDVKEEASASVLFTAKETKTDCVFCNMRHDNIVCDSARKLTLEERKNVLKKERACFNCLKQGHVSHKCRMNVKCDWCARRHALIMCFHLTDKVVHKNDAKENKENVKPTVDDKVDNNLTTFCEHKVYLQTLRVIVFSQSRERVVRAVIDTASQRSYIRADLAKELGYTSLNKQKMSHSLFGEIKSESKTHDVFKIRLTDIDRTYMCNFDVMDQDTICNTIPCIRDDQHIDELRKKNICLSDIRGNSNEIDVLIGADIAGKLLTGRKYSLKNGLTAFETRLGWTVMGKLPSESRRSDTASMVTTLMVHEANITDMWSLDVIGISDPIGKASQTLREEQTRKFLLETTKINDEGRYEVKLPWINDHAPISNNYEIARNRLNKCLVKLDNQKLFDEYDKIFKQWLTDGVIERVLDDENNIELSHYLPHRPVVKAYGTTKIRPVFDASAHSAGEPSLNQCLEKGPNLIELIPIVLNKFRERELYTFRTYFLYRYNSAYLFAAT